MRISFTPQAWEDYLYWQTTDKKMLKRINLLLLLLIKDIRRSPFEGKGKPEPLKYELSGLWSRRITEEHRLVYEVTEDALTLTQCRFHYD